jgi:hypothetical protein
VPRRFELGGAGPASSVESAARRARRTRGGELSVATVYANVNEQRPADYWDYDSLHVRWGCVISALSLLIEAGAHFNCVGGGFSRIVAL